MKADAVPSIWMSGQERFWFAWGVRDIGKVVFRDPVFADSGASLKIKVINVNLNAMAKRSRVFQSRWINKLVILTFRSFLHNSIN